MILAWILRNLILQSNCMENLSSIETSSLVDLLSEYTAKFTQMMSEGGEQEEYAKYKFTIEALQKEISSRKAAYGENATQSASAPEFE